MAHGAFCDFLLIVCAIFCSLKYYPNKVIYSTIIKIIKWKQREGTGALYTSAVLWYWVNAAIQQMWHSVKTEIQLIVM